jgi:hypothetical protein
MRNLTIFLLVATLGVLVTSCGADGSVAGTWVLDVEATVAAMEADLATRAPGSHRKGLAEAAVGFVRRIAGEGTVTLKLAADGSATMEGLLPPASGEDDPPQKPVEAQWSSRGGDVRVEVQGSPPLQFRLKDGRLIHPVEVPRAAGEREVDEVSLVFKRATG